MKENSVLDTSSEGGMKVGAEPQPKEEEYHKKGVGSTSDDQRRLRPMRDDRQPKQTS